LELTDYKREIWIRIVSDKKEKQYKGVSGVDMVKYFGLDSRHGAPRLTAG
jgi:hypothetical protein